MSNTPLVIELVHGTWALGILNWRENDQNIILVREGLFNVGISTTGSYVTWIET